jgi:uncharacterized protein YbjT (DUF2867 family)
MGMRIAVAGGTGVSGRQAVVAAEATGHQVVIVSRKSGVDARTGTGLAGALEGVEVIIDATNAPTTKRDGASAFFTEVTERLQSVGEAQGVSRLVMLSIVGLERVPGYGYYQAKLAHEAAALAGPLPTTIVRATQFHEFPAQILARLPGGPLAAMPRMRIQPIAAHSVGQVLVEAATAGSTDGATVEVAGPEQKELVDLARAVVRRRGKRTVVLPLPVPGRAGRAMRTGGPLPGPGVRLVGPTFDEWLAGTDLSALFS